MSALPSQTLFETEKEVAEEGEQVIEAAVADEPVVTADTLYLVEQVVWPGGPSGHVYRPEQGGTFGSTLLLRGESAPDRAGKRF